MAIDAILAWLDYTDLVVYFFAKFAVRDYCFFFDADLYKISVVDFTVQAPAVDILWVDFNPVRAAVKLAFFRKAAGTRWSRKIY